MPCRLFGAKPLSEPILPYCQWDPKEHISVKFYFKLKSFHSKRCIQKCCLRNGGHFVSASMCYGDGPEVLTMWQAFPMPSSWIHAHKWVLISYVSILSGACNVRGLVSLTSQELMIMIIHIWINKFCSNLGNNDVKFCTYQHSFIGIKYKCQIVPDFDHYVLNKCKTQFRQMRYLIININAMGPWGPFHKRFTSSY